MGYFSELAAEEYYVGREPSYPSRRDTLQYFLEDLQSKLEALDEQRPHDPLNPDFNRYFYSDCVVHYYENPSTVQDVLYAIKEVSELIEEMDAAAAIRCDDAVSDPNQITIWSIVKLPSSVSKAA